MQQDRTVTEKEPQEGLANIALWRFWGGREDPSQVRQAGGGQVLSWFLNESSTVLGKEQVLNLCYCDWI